MIIWVSVVLKGTVVTVTDVSSTSVEVIIIVKVNCVSSACQGLTHPDDHTQPTCDIQ